MLKNKYLKYKKKYLELRKQLGGMKQAISFQCSNCQNVIGVEHASFVREGKIYCNSYCYDKKQAEEEAASIAYKIVQQAPVVIRGVCPYCNKNVTINHKRYTHEGQYYHIECPVKITPAPVAAVPHIRKMSVERQEYLKRLGELLKAVKLLKTVELTKNDEKIAVAKIAEIEARKATIVAKNAAEAAKNAELAAIKST